MIATYKQLGLRRIRLRYPQEYKHSSVEHILYLVLRQNVKQLYIEGGENFWYGKLRPKALMCLKWQGRACV